MYTAQGIVSVAEEYRNTVETAATITIFIDNEEKDLENLCSLASQDFKQMHGNITKYWESFQWYMNLSCKQQQVFT